MKDVWDANARPSSRCAGERQGLRMKIVHIKRCVLPCVLLVHPPPVVQAQSHSCFHSASGPTHTLPLPTVEIYAPPLVVIILNVLRRRRCVPREVCCALGSVRVFICRSPIGWNAFRKLFRVLMRASWENRVLLVLLVGPKPLASSGVTNSMRAPIGTIRGS